MVQGYHGGSFRAPPNRIRVTKLFTDVAAVPEPRSELIGLWVRRAVLTIFAALAVLGLLDVFGQATTQTVASTPAATLRGHRAAGRARRPVLPVARRDPRAARDRAPAARPRPGWVEGMQFNSNCPPRQRGRPRRSRRAELRALAAGERLIVWMQFEVDPTNVGHRSYGLELDDAETKVAAVHRDITVFPSAMDLVLRTIFVFFLILLITRAVGRRELSSMEPFDLILLVVIGDLVQQGVTQSDYSLTGATMVIVTVALLTVGHRVAELPRPAPATRAGGRSDHPRRRRAHPRAQPAPPADDRRRAGRRGAARADRLAGRGPLRGARDERQDQLPHARVRLTLRAGRRRE